MSKISWNIFPNDWLIGPTWKVFQPLTAACLFSRWLSSKEHRGGTEETWKVRSLSRRNGWVKFGSPPLLSWPITASKYFDVTTISLSAGQTIEVTHLGPRNAKGTNPGTANSFPEMNRQVDNQQFPKIIAIWIEQTRASNQWLVCWYFSVPTCRDWGNKLSIFFGSFDKCFMSAYYGSDLFGELYSVFHANDPWFSFINGRLRLLTIPQVSTAMNRISNSMTNPEIITHIDYSTTKSR